MRLGDALAGSHWPEFVDLADRGQITAREASQRYSRLGGRNRFDVDAVVDAAEKLPDAHDLAPPAAVARRPDPQGHDKPVESDRTARGGSEGEPEAKQPLRSANFVNIQVP